MEMSLKPVSSCQISRRDRRGAGFRLLCGLAVLSLSEIRLCSDGASRWMLLTTRASQERAIKQCLAAANVLCILWPARWHSPRLTSTLMIVLVTLHLPIGMNKVFCTIRAAAKQIVQSLQPEPVVTDADRASCASLRYSSLDTHRNGGGPQTVLARTPRAPCCSA